MRERSILRLYYIILCNKHRRRKKYELFTNEQDSTIELRIASTTRNIMGPTGVVIFGYLNISMLLCIGMQL